MPFKHKILGVKNKPRLENRFLGNFAKLFIKLYLRGVDAF